MLTLMDRRPTHTCSGYSRREFLRIGGLALGGLTLPQLLASRAGGAEAAGFLRGRSVVLLFLQGGPPHIEFFDPKMTAGSEIRSITGEVPTVHPGITFGGTFPQLASRADHFTVVRNYGTGNGGHSYESVTTAGNPTQASMGALYARIRGNNHPATGMPTNVLVLPEAVQDGLQFEKNFETGALPTLTQTGTLGASYAAFNPAGGGQLQKDMELRMPPERLEDRRNLLQQLDAVRRRLDHDPAFDGFDTYRRQAFDVIARCVAEAFDLSKEDSATVERYDTSKLFAMRDLTRFYDMRRVSNLLGRQMLLARRLCEAGCGFVTVSDCGWDYHANNNSPKGMTGIYPMGAQVDHAVSAFIDDVRARGLEDKILLVVTGEMGRTPRINNNGGRDHYGELTSLLLFGGGLRMGQVIGESDSQAGRAIGEPYRPQHLMATVLHTLFDIGQLRLERGMPQEIIRLAEAGRPIDNLL